MTDVQDTPIQDTPVQLKKERQVAKAEIRQATKRLASIFAVVIEARPDLKREVTTAVGDLLKSIEDNTKVLSKKAKKQSSKARDNLTRSCCITPQFAAYVSDLVAEGKFGKVPKDGPLRDAIDLITKKHVSSLLVSTLIISCDNYHLPKVGDATFRVTPLMKKHLSEVLEGIVEDRRELHEQDPSKDLFDYNKYSSAMNNTIASRVRDIQSEEGNNLVEDEDTAALLANFKAYLKEHNAHLRENRVVQDAE